MSAPLIQMVGIEFAYDAAHPVFTGLDFSLAQGQRVGLTGANGSGKSTLLHLITGLLRPAQGTIEAFGKCRRQERDFLEVRRQAGYLLQDSEDQLFCPTVLEDLMFGPLNFGDSPAVAREKAMKTLERLGLLGYEHRVTYRLSGGEKRMVALAAVLAMEPRVLLLDEPTTGLDAETEARLAAILEKLDQEMILITHNRRFLERVTNTVYLLDNSRLVATA